MPNHCHNDLYIDGPAAEVAALLSLIGGDKPEPEFDFNSVTPYPSDFAERDKEAHDLGYKAFAEKYGQHAKDGYNSGGYEWCTANWGTKWNAYDVVRRDYMGVCLTFQTAWSPPRPVIIALAKRFPLCTLSLESFESGAAYACGFTLIPKDDWYEEEPWEAGKVSQEWRGQYLGNRGG